MADKKLSDLTGVSPDDAQLIPVETADGTRSVVLGDVKTHVLAGLAPATTSVDGLMAHADKTKLNGIATSADVTADANVRAALAGATANVSFNSKRLTTVADPSSAQDVATKNYVDTHASASPIIWKWNETDTSQFTVGIDQHSSVVLSKVTGRQGSRLRIAFPTKVTGLQLTTIYINDLSLPVVNTDVRRYIFEFRLVGIADFTHYNEWYSFGAAHTMNKASGTSHYAMASMFQVGTATRGAKVEGATGVSLSNGTPAGVSLGGMISSSSSDERIIIAQFRNEMVLRTPAATKPQFNALIGCTYPGFNGSLTMGGLTSDVGFVADMGALVSGWTSQTLDTCGFGILGSTGTTSNYYFEVDQICVRKHPMDL